MSSFHGKEFVENNFDKIRDQSSLNRSKLSYDTMKSEERVLHDRTLLLDFEMSRIRQSSMSRQAKDSGVNTCIPEYNIKLSHSKDVMPFFSPRGGHNCSADIMKLIQDESF